MKFPAWRWSRTSMRVSHLTLATPYQPGAIKRTGNPFLWGRSLAVHLVAEQVAGVERVVERHAAGELLGDRQSPPSGGMVPV